MRQLFLILFMLLPATLFAQPLSISKVQVDQSFIDLYAGPGEDFERVDVALRGDWLNLLEQKGGWVQVSTKEQRRYWITYQQLLGCKVDQQGPYLFQVLPENWYRDTRSLGFAVGYIADSPAIQISYTHELNDFLALDFRASGIAEEAGSSALYQAGLQLSPFDTQNWHTYIEASGGGYYRSYDEPGRSGLNRNMAGIALATSYRMSERFDVSLRAQYHTLFQARANEPDNLKGIFFLLEYTF